jgi:hypothetical protein
VVKNKYLVGENLTVLRKFSSTHIDSFSWDGGGLWPAWKTRKMNGFIRDYAFGTEYPFDGLTAVGGHPADPGVECSPPLKAATGQGGSSVHGKHLRQTASGFQKNLPSGQTFD